ELNPIEVITVSGELTQPRRVHRHKLRRHLDGLGVMRCRVHDCAAWYALGPHAERGQHDAATTCVIDRMNRHLACGRSYADMVDKRVKRGRSSGAMLGFQLERQAKPHVDDSRVEGIWTTRA